jgi:hypothetical protein
MVFTRVQTPCKLPMLRSAPEQLFGEARPRGISPRPPIVTTAATAGVKATPYANSTLMEIPHGLYTFGCRTPSAIAPSARRS